MSTSPSIDAYDAQMLDFSSDPDVPMNTTGSAEFFAEALMDHDGHLLASTYSEHASVEVDMEEYVGDNAEYEMADETAEYQRLHGDDLLDIEVYDASHVPSPLAPPQPLQPSVDVPIDSENPAPTPSAFSDHAALPDVPPDPESEAHSAPPGRLSADVPYVEPQALGEVVSSDVEHSTDAVGENILPVSESREQLGDTAPADGEPFETPVPAAADDEVEPPVPPVTEEHLAGSKTAQHENQEHPTTESTSLTNGENAYDSGPPVPDGKVTEVIEQAPLTEGETVDPLHISDGVYIDPPPAVLLSIAETSQPGFALFNQPDVEDESTEESHGDRKVYSLLLENRPTLYYEPLTSVFEALRQDEDLLSRVPHNFEGELVLDAYDLQLAISEDNMHSREVSLHDLNILHDGSDFVGPLRLLLRALVPRFIVRYYALQDHVQRLSLATETGEERNGAEHHEHYDANEEKPRPPQENPTGQSSTHGVVASESLEVPPTEEAEEPAKEPVIPSESTEETLHDNFETGSTSSVHEPVAEYHQVTGEIIHALEDENDYEGTNAGDEGDSAKSERLDAVQLHGTTAEDTEISATVIVQESEFGGEETEYLDYVQPEEYDERYNGDLPERARDASPVHYDDPEGEQNTSTIAGEAQAVPVGSDEGEEDRSAATPIPSRAALESDTTDPVDKNVTNDLVLSTQDKSEPSKELSTSDSTNDVDHKLQASGNQETSISQAKVFSEVDESDANLASILEREADAEFDQTFNPEQNGQEGSIEAVLQHDETWDEWDDEDAEGEDEEDWIDPDAVSNESSVTLSSKASSKRSYDEVDPSAEAYVEDPRNSPGPKRPRVQ